MVTLPHETCRRWLGESRGRFNQLYSTVCKSEVLHNSYTSVDWVSELVSLRNSTRSAHGRCFRVAGSLDNVLPLTF